MNSCRAFRIRLCREREARERGLKYRVKNETTSTWYSSRRVAERYSGYKVLVEEGTDRILGAHLLGDQSCGNHQSFCCGNTIWDARHGPEAHGVFVSHAQLRCAVHVVTLPDAQTLKEVLGPPSCLLPCPPRFLCA